MSGHAVSPVFVAEENGVTPEEDEQFVSTPLNAAVNTIAVIRRTVRYITFPYLGINRMLKAVSCRLLVWTATLA